MLVVEYCSWSYGERVPQQSWVCCVSPNIVSTRVLFALMNRLVEAVQKANVSLRSGCDKFLHTLRRHQVRLFIVSAGITDLIEEILRSKAAAWPSKPVDAEKLGWAIISNRMRWYAIS